MARIDDREENRRIFRQMQIDAATRFMRKWNQEMAAMTLDQILDSHPDGRAWEAYYKALRARLAEVPDPVPSKRSRR